MERAMHVIVILAAAAFVWATGQNLPDLVASRFGASGAADARMPREAYVRFMAALTAIVPLVLAWLPGWTIRAPGARIKIPNADVWLSHDRVEGTLDFLSIHFGRLGVLSALLMLRVHLLVVQANASRPPRLANGPFVSTLVLFAVGLVGWIVWMNLRFKRPADGE
jgi:hypothetical protein